MDIAFFPVCISPGYALFSKFIEQTAEFTGEKFEDLAKRFSKCPSGKKGGDLGWFRPGDMVPEFDQAAFSAEKGKVVGPIKTQFGFHLLIVTDQK